MFSSAFSKYVSGSQQLFFNLSQNFNRGTQNRAKMKLLAFTLFTIYVLPNNNGVEGFNEFFNKGYKKSKKITIPTTTIVQPPQCSPSCPTPCPAPPVQCPPVQCPEVHCPEVHCSPVQCPTVNCPEVNCPEVHCPTVVCPTPEPQPCYQSEPCECNPETPLSPVSFQF